MAKSHKDLEFSDLTLAYKNPSGTRDAVIGVVTDVQLPPKQTQTSDWMLTFTITDATLQKLDIKYGGGIKVRIFCDEEAQLPQIKSVGDVVALRHIKLSRFQGIPLILSVKRVTSYAVFPKDDIPPTVPAIYENDPSTSLPEMCRSICYSHGHMWKPTLKDQAAAVLTKSSTTRSPDAMPRSAADDTKNDSTYRTRRFGLIKDAEVNKFYDFLVQVVKIFPDPFGKYEVYVTDYTSHPLLFNYPAPEEEEDDDDLLGGRDGDAFGYMPTGKREWPGPYGSMTLKVEVMEPHASFIGAKVKEGDTILMSNVRIKMSNQNKMEGNMWTDRAYPKKVNIQLRSSNDASIDQELDQRREAYDTKRGKVLKKRTGEQQQPLSKAQRKKAKKKAAALAQKVHGDAPVKQQQVTVIANKHVRCLTIDDIETRTIYELAHAERSFTTSQNKKRKIAATDEIKSLVRVVDFYPPSLEDFTQPVDAAETNDDDPLDMDYLTPKWEWIFTLLVEDANLPENPTDEQRTQMWLQVNHEDAEFLLNMDAADLKSNKTAIAKLREKMAILWGNLEERKLEAQKEGRPYPPTVLSLQDEERTVPTDPDLSNLPFDCCIRRQDKQLEDYDISQTPDGHIQIFGMFGTSIK